MFSYLVNFLGETVSGVEHRENHRDNHEPAGLRNKVGQTIERFLLFQHYSKDDRNVNHSKQGSGFSKVVLKVVEKD